MSRVVSSLLSSHIINSKPSYRHTYISTLQTVSIHRLKNNCSKEREKLRIALTDVGFFYISDCLSDSMIAEAHQCVRSSFDMTVEEKREIHLSKSQHFRGWSSVNEEFTLGMPDFKETFDFGLDETATDTKGWKSLRGPNQWPSRNQVQFRSFLNQYIFEMCKVGRIIMNNAALILDRDPKELAPYFEHPFSIVRFIKYPPTREKQQGIGPHTDYGFLTMILQDDGVAGLEAQTRSGEWISVPPLKNTFAVNIGDALQAWSCDVFRATPHRVLNPECERSRYSIPFFLNPTWRANCLMQLAILLL